MKLMEKMRQKRMGNKGFSLVELIIVIAIMAILIGIVGTQVIPYLNRAREAKDMQIISSYSTAAVAVYSYNAEKFATPEANGATLTISVYGTSDTWDDVDSTYGAAAFKADIVALTGYATDTALGNAMTSAEGQKITDVTIEIDFGAGTITATAVGPAATSSFEPAISHISGGTTP